jgi:hypothetical protein
MEKIKPIGSFTSFVKLETLELSPVLLVRRKDGSYDQENTDEPNPFDSDGGEENLDEAPRDFLPPNVQKFRLYPPHQRTVYRTMDWLTEVLPSLSVSAARLQVFDLSIGQWFGKAVAFFPRVYISRAFLSGLGRLTTAIYSDYHHPSAVDLAKKMHVSIRSDLYSRDLFGKRRAQLL